MVLWSQERKQITIKLIYRIEDIILWMVILNISETWNNGHNTTFRDSYLEDDNSEILPNGNAPYVIKGNGDCVHVDSLGVSKNFGDGH